MNVAAVRSPAIHRIYLLAGLAAVAVYYVLPWDSFAQTIVYDAIGASAAAASIAGAQLFRPSLRLPWYLFAAGMLAFSIGDVLFNLYSFVWHRDPPVPSIADVFCLAGYPLLTAGFVLLVRCLQSEDRRRGRLDAAMLIAAFALCQWIFLMQDRLHTGSVAERLVALSYPAMDVILLAALVFFALTPTWRTVAYRYLAASIVLLIFADEVYGLSPAAYSSASWLDSALLLSYVLCGLVLLRLTSVIHALEELRVTERLARAEAETAQRLLTEQNERLREADRLKDEFVALISHDLRTPLTSITGYVELALEEEELSDDVRGFLHIVARNADRLLVLVNDLLFVARLQAGEMTLEREHVDLASVVRDGVGAMEPRAAAKGIALTCVVDSVSPVYGDSGRMLRVVDNLVSNAIKFTREGGTVHVSLREDGDSVRLEVSDSGIGIGSDDQRRLFQRFYRAENAVELQIPGTGLGLYICRVIAEAHEGSLSVRSELGRGSTFTFEVPLAH